MRNSRAYETAKAGVGARGSSLVPFDNVTKSIYKSVAQVMAKKMGWTGAEWEALHKLWDKESGWNPKAANATSSARGIPQTMMSVHFGKDWQRSPTAQAFLSNPMEQIKWGLNYIKSRYGSPSKAWENSRKFNFY